MKVKINDFDIEGEISEIFELINMNKKIVKKNIESVKEDKQIIFKTRKNKFHKICEICKKDYIARTPTSQKYCSINCRMVHVRKKAKAYYDKNKDLILSKQREKSGMKTGKKHDRTHFINNYANNLMKQDNSLSREEALKRASFKYADKKRFEEIFLKEKFPQFNSLASDIMPIFESICESVIKQNGTFKFNEMSYTLKIDNYQHWESFCYEFMLNSSKICLFYQVKDRFVFSKENNVTEIKYF